MPATKLNAVRRNQKEDEVKIKIANFFGCSVRDIFYRPTAEN